MGQVAKRLWKDIKGFVPVAALYGIYYLVSHRLYDAFCPLLIVTGIPCAGCGLTRAGLFLLKGQVLRAASLNPAIFLFVSFLLYCAYFRYLKGQRVKRLGPALILLVTGTLLIYGYRMYLYFPGRVPYVYQEHNLFADKIPGYSALLHRILNRISLLRS